MINNDACLFGDTSTKGGDIFISPFFINNSAKQTMQMKELIKDWQSYDPWMEELIKDLQSFDPGVPDPSEFIQTHIVTDKMKEAISIGNKGNKSKTGQKLSEETKRKISKAHMGKKGFPISPEMRKKLNEGRRKAQCFVGENNPRARHYEITFEDGRVEHIKSLETWARANGYVPMSIRNLYNGNGNKKHKDIIKVRPL